MQLNDKLQKPYNNYTLCIVNYELKCDTARSAESCVPARKCPEWHVACGAKAPLIQRPLGRDNSCYLPCVRTTNITNLHEA